jgi:hypothetical protein
MSTSPGDGKPANLVLEPDIIPRAVGVQTQDELGPKESPRPVRVYTRPQLLYLQKSPLVKPPAAMPELKEWFGCDLILFAHIQFLTGHNRSENEQNLSRKDAEPSTPNSARERRFVLLRI